MNLDWNVYINLFYLDFDTCTDAPIRDRLFGAPIGSSTWVMTFCCSFQLIWRLMLTEDQVKGQKISKVFFLAFNTSKENNF